MATVVVIGASRGLGLGLVEAYAKDGHQVHATVRDLTAPGGPRNVKGDVFLHELDVRNEEQLSALQAALPAVDILIHNAGISATHVDEDTLHAVNVEAPIRVVTALLSKVNVNGRIVLMSSLMGSRDGRSGKLTPYGESKAALNDSFRACVGSWPGVAVVMHPGWVRTDMGGNGAPLSVAQSVNGMCKVIARLETAQHGHFMNYDGSELPW